MLPQENRLRKTKEFQGVFAKGKGFKAQELLLKAAFEKNNNAPRLGIVVSKKVAKEAVIRNRIRRVIREAAREELDKVKRGARIAIVVLPGFTEKGKEDTKKTIQQLLKKASAFQ